MRGMYDKDGNIAYAGKCRASTPWRSSRFKRPSAPRTPSHSDPILARDNLERHLQHKENIAAIIASSKWNNHNYNQH